MARLPQPSKVLEMRGAHRKHPERKRKHEPVPRAGIGPAPRHLTPGQAAIWDEIVGITPAGVLGDSDRVSLESLVKLVDDMRQDFSKFTGSKMSQMISLLARFGLTPADRTRISVPSGKGGNEFEDL